MCPFHVKFCLIILLAASGLFSYARAADDSSTAADTSTVSVTSSEEPETTTVSGVESTTSVTSTLVTEESTTSATSTSEIAESTTSTSTAVPVLSTCDNLSVMENIDILGISGSWYEMARKGYGTYIQNLQCLQMNMTYMNGTAWVYQTYATDLQSLHNQTTYLYIVQYSTTNISDYSISYTNYGYLPVPVFKILDTDYENYLIVCSYLPIWQKSAAAFVYFRNRNTPDSDIYSVVNNASAKYVDFTGMNLVYQGPDCNSVSRVVPMGVMISVLFAIYLLKIMH